MLRRLTLLTLICISVLSIKAQNSYNSIGVTGSYFIPSGSIPIRFSGNRAKSFGIFYEHYFKTNFKIKAALNNYTTTYKDRYSDTSDKPQWYTFNASARFISIPLILSYNFDANNKDWEFFVDVGYSLFIQQYNKTEKFPQSFPLIPQYQKNTSNYNHYFIVGFGGRYKLYDYLYAGLGTLSYHYLKLNSNEGIGFPTLSIDASVAYIF